MNVDSVRRFGLFGRCQDYTILVPIPEISWIASYCSCEQFASAGDSVTVKILYVNSEERKARASIKALYPDPWQDPDKLLAGSTVEATVVRYVQSADRCGGRAGYLVALDPGAYAMLCDPGVRLKVGGTCSIRVVSARPDKRAVELRLAAQ